MINFSKTPTKFLNGYELIDKKLQFQYGKKVFNLEVYPTSISFQDAESYSEVWYGNIHHNETFFILTKYETDIIVDTILFFVNKSYECNCINDLVQKAATKQTLDKVKIYWNDSSVILMDYTCEHQKSFEIFINKSYLNSSEGKIE
jgi:hypothetical protein